MKAIYPDIAEECFELVVLSAKRLVDRALWSDVDDEVFEAAKLFLSENRSKIFGLRNREINLYLKTPGWLYRLGRRFKHFVGKAIKSLRSR